MRMVLSNKKPSLLISVATVNGLDLCLLFSFIFGRKGGSMSRLDLQTSLWSAVIILLLLGNISRR